MTKNLLKPLRNSYITNSLLTGLLSNLMIFGPTSELLFHAYATPMTAPKTGSSKNQGYTYSDENSFTELTPPGFFHTKSLKENRLSENSQHFEALEKQGVIGKQHTTEADNTADNYFTIELPEDFSPKKYDASLTYTLFGLVRASHTIKSINGSLAYGGLLAEQNENWTNVEETLPAHQLKPGINEIYFTRRADENYQYQVKDLKITLTPKSSRVLKTTEDALVIHKGTVYLLGHVSDPAIENITVSGETIPVTNGVFEGLIRGLPEKSKSLTVTSQSTDGTVQQTQIALTGTTQSPGLLFEPSTVAVKKARHTQDTPDISYYALRVETLPASGIELWGLEFKDLRGLDSEIKNVTPEPFHGYRIERKNLADSVSLQLSLAYDPAKIPDGYTPRDVRTFYYDKNQRTWKGLPVDSLDFANSRILVTSQGDTDYINGIITVPEMPETASFAPTTITDMEFANPAAGIVSIPPPTPNSTGIASTSFPIKLPPGRNGVMPSLNVSYNSEAGNGWMGIGWDLHLPSVTLNTKWGAPRFTPGTETELYTLNGEELVLNTGGTYTNPHRQANISRTNNRIFYARKEGAYQTIQRMGTSPQNYYWIVTDKQGNKSYYGGKSSVDNNAVIRDSNNNIVHWALYRTEDTHGNYVSYIYTKNTVTLNGSTVTAQEFYPDRIRYTLHPGQTNTYYEVFFRRNSYTVGGSGTLTRQDFILSGRLGTLQYTKDLLTEVRVGLVENGGTMQTIRTYRFDYSTIAFQKQQLQRIAEYDAGNLLFYSNTMEYFNESTGSGLFNNPVNWSGSSDNIGTIPLSGMSGVPASFVLTGSALGTSTTTGWNAGLRVGVGIGNKMIEKNATIGGGFNYTKNNQTSLISFVDINGDGLPDKVFKSGSSIQYRINTGSGFGGLYSISGISSLDQTISRTTGGSIDGYFYATIAGSKSKTRSNTDGYFIDFNGDGLPDMIQNGNVRFNTSTNQNNQLLRSFTTSVANTENTIVPGAVNSQLVEDLSLPTLLEVREEHPQFDAVKVWQAPYTGVVNITGQAKLIVKNVNSGNPNNFRISIERTPGTNGIAAAVGAWPVGTLSSVNQTINTNRSSISVTKGDRIFFRTHNLDNGSGGVVEWNPVVTYTTGSTSFNFTDENGKQANSFNAAQDFILTNGSPVEITGVSSATLNFNLNLNNFQGINYTDNIRFKVQLIREDLSNENEIILNTWTRTYNHVSETFSGAANQISNITLSTSSNYRYYFHCTIESDSNINWGAITWKPTVVAGGETHYAQVNHKLYNDNVSQFVHRITAAQLPNPNINDPQEENDPLLVIQHNLNDSQINYTVLNDLGNTFSIPVYLVVKGETNGVVSVLGRRTITINRTSGQYSVSPATPQTIVLTKAQVANADNLYVAFYTESAALAHLISNNSFIGTPYPPVIHLSLTQAEQGQQIWNEITLQKPFFAHNPNVFGNAYRGWGQFLYNGGIKLQRNQEDEIVFSGANPVVETNYGTTRINTSVFPEEGQYGDLQNDVEGIDGNTDPNNLPALAVTPRYSLYKQDNFNDHYQNEAIIQAICKLNSGTIRTTLGRFGEGNLFDVYVSPQSLIGGQSFPGIRQYSVSKGTGVTFGAFGASQSESWSESQVLNMFIDLNGDRYPDLVTGNRVQYTNLMGSLSETHIHNFSTGSKGQDHYTGISFTPPNSTNSSNGKAKGNVTNLNMQAGIGAGNGSSSDEKTWIDINGDGLPDQIRMDDNKAFVRLNTGYGFSNEVIWGNNLDQTTSSRVNANGSATFPINSKSGSWGIGAGFNTSFANRLTYFLDINGDGLPDWVYRSGSSYYYRLNTGKEFSATAILLYSGGNIDEDRSFGGNAFGTFTYGFPLFSLFGITIKMTLTPSAGASMGLNHKEISMQDIDGDGYVDILQKGSGNTNLNVRLSKIGKTHLLKKVNTPLGGSWEIAYTRDGNTYDMPQSKWVMSRVSTHDGFTADNAFGPDQTVTDMSYDYPKYDRREREFLGYEQMRIEEKNPANNQTFRYSITRFHNENVYLKGLEKESSLYDSNDVLLSESRTLYNLLHPETPQVNMNANAVGNYLQSGLQAALLDHSRLFVAPVKTVSTSYENGQGLSLEQRFITYDSYGNLLTYRNMGDTYTNTGVSGGDAFRTELEYYPPNTFGSLQNATGFVKKIQVIRQEDGQLMRQREAEYTSLGRLSKVTTKLNDTEENRVTMGYNAFGNRTSITLLDSQDQVGNPFYLNISYDPVLNTHPVASQDAFGHTSSATFNYLFGVPTLTQDRNSQQLRTRIDNRGRIVEVTAPNEMPSGWTLRMQYKGEPALTTAGSSMVTAQGSFAAVNPGAAQPTNAKHHAVTRHNVAGAAGGQLLTVSLVDGLGSPIQLKKTLFSSGTTRWLLNGKEEKDAFGRTLKAWLPTNQGNYPTNMSTLNTQTFDYVSATHALPPTQMVYDVRDRVVSVQQPGETQAAVTVYDIEDGMFTSTMTNELGQTLKTFTDIRGRQRKAVQNNELTTRFYYNAVGEKVRVKNHQGYETTYRYDLAGRRTEERHPDRGLQAFVYDPGGNLIKRYTSNLLAGDTQQEISYQYTFNRLEAISYPQAENNVTYIYGSPNDAAAIDQNAVGRLFMQQDASGVQGFGYDKLGNLTSHLRSVAVAGRHSFWFHTQWEYDSHNRVMQMTYPDGEVINYLYNPGGELNSITSTIAGVPNTQNIVSSITYTDLGERQQITYGNGTVTNYTYDTRRRMKDLNHIFTDFQIKKEYTYDPLSNITAINTLNPQNSIPNTGQIGGPADHQYVYDDYNRLVSAQGRYTGSNDLTTPLLAQEYTLEMQYDLAHNIISKKQTHIQGEVSSYSASITDPETMLKTNYKLDYSGYAGADYITNPPGGGDELGYVQPHAPRKIIEVPEEGCCQEGDPRYKKTLIDYDANGNQTTLKQWISNAEPGVDPEVITLRRNLWDNEDRLRAVDLNPEESDPHPVAVYTYDAAGQRVVRYIPGRVDAYSNAGAVSLNQRDEVMLYPNALVTAKALSEPGVMPTARDKVTRYTKHYYIGATRVSSALGTTRGLGLWPKWMHNKFPGIQALAGETVAKATEALAATYTEFGQNLSLPTPTGEEEISNFIHNAQQYDVYYYHSDHLGSSNYISNLAGRVSQHMEYMPFGELLVDEHLNSYNTPFKFNAKELDEETGNYYYGARYYDPKFSVWLSVDPLAEKYPGISSYVLCAQNPIINKEIDGRYFIFIPGLGYSTQSGYKNSPYVSAYGGMVDEFDRSRGGLGGATINGSRGGQSSLGNRFHDGLYVLWWGSSVRGNIRNDYRAMNIINHVADSYSKVREAGDNFDIMATSQGTVSAAQAMVAMLNNPTDFGLPEDFHLDNVYMAGSMVDPSSELGQTLQSFADSGKIGNLQYVSAPGDTIEGTGSTSRSGAFGNANKFIKMVSGELKASSNAKKQGTTYSPIHPHVRAAENLPNNPSSGCSTSACEVRQAIQSTYKE